MTVLRAIGQRLIWTPLGAWTDEDDDRRTRAAATSQAVDRLALSEYETRMIRPLGHQRNSPPTFEPVTLSDADAAVVGEAIGEQAEALGYALLALAVGPDRVELVMQHHRDRPEDTIEQLKHAARVRLHAKGDAWTGHPVWSAGGWHVPLERRAQLADAVHAVAAEAEAFDQHWPFLETSKG